jgi:hypothetical protein
LVFLEVIFDFLTRPREELIDDWDGEVLERQAKVKGNVLLVGNEGRGPGDAYGFYKSSFTEF